jgi:hypothetical protein
VKGLTRILAVVIMISAGVMISCCRKLTAPLAIPVHDSTTTEVNNSYTLEDKPGIPDSASIFALLQCDSLGNIYLKTITQLQGEIVNQALELENNVLKVIASSRTREKKESIKKDSIRIEYKEKPVPYPVETITNRLTSWQSFQIWIGRLVLIALVLYLVIKYGGSKLSIISKLFKKQ